MIPLLTHHVGFNQGSHVGRCDRDASNGRLGRQLTAGNGDLRRVLTRDSRRVLDQIPIARRIDEEGGVGYAWPTNTHFQPCRNEDRQNWSLLTGLEDN